MQKEVMEKEALQKRYEEAGQSHVFEHYESLSPEEQFEFRQQLSSIDIEKIRPLLASTLAMASSAANTANATIAPFDKNVGRSTDPVLTAQCEKIGMDAIRKGQVAALVLAGGQGTRLGFSGPKGMYDIGMPSHKSLFQLIVERIRRLRELAHNESGSHQVSLPFYVMTSPLNHKETVQFFQEHQFFGANESDVIFFQQGMLPCLEENGKVILEGPGRVALAPDGNGGIYPSLQSSGCLDDMIARGIQYLHVFSIDNALVKPADPVFIGYCIQQKADCGNKVVWKAHAHEKVGVVATRDSKPCIVEYSEITREMAEETTNGDGRLVYGAGNICNHFYTIDFITDKILPQMSNLYHIARKKIPYYDVDKKATVTPTEENGIKLETFIFDVFPMSENMVVLDVDRRQEFSPVKNKAGSSSDSPDTARAMLSALAQEWMEQAGAILLLGTNENGDDGNICEISPLTSYSGEGLESYKGKEVKCPFSI